MPPATTSSFVEVLTEHNLLEPGRLNELTPEVQARFADPRALASELVKRGWLTSFQAEAVLRGQGGKLALGPYVLLDRLGEGGMGTVFKARHRLMRRIVALKLIRKGHLPHAEAVRRFEQEIQAAAQLSHPNVVHAYDAGHIGEHPYFAMEYVQGKTLSQVLAKHGPFPIHFACDCARQAALGLQHAHERGLIHRDIKPSNLLLTTSTPGGRRDQVKILDMGLARAHYDPADKGAKVLTQLGTVMGSPNYIAPEQTFDAHKVDIRADIYALGCSLYELLTGQPPFPSGDVMQKLQSHVCSPPRPVQELRADVPPDLAELLHRMLAKRPEDRYQTPAEVAEALAPFCQAEPPRAPVPVAVVPPESIKPASNGPPPQVSDTPVPQATAPALAPANVGDSLRESSRSRSERPTLPRLLAGAALAVIVAGTIWLLTRSPEPPPPAPPPPESITNSLGMKLVLIPAGKFLMGSPPGEPGHTPAESPQTEIKISKPFYLGEYEVTQEQYAKLMGNNPSHFQLARKTGGGPQYPVESVTWSQAVEFCHRLSELPEERKANRVYRLPTSAEWEYVCRAGTTTPFHFGVKLEAWNANFKGGGTVQVGSYPANAWKVHDLHGNVAEWCHDWFDPDYYRGCPREDPQGPLLGTFRTVRGGGYSAPAAACRSAHRVSQNGAQPHTGFRVVCEIDGEWFPSRSPSGLPVQVTFDPQYLDRLDPSKLPPENRFAGQPKGLRWVLGEHRVRHPTNVSAVAVAPNEKSLATGNASDGTIRIADASTLRELRNFVQPGPGVWSLRFSPDGKLLAAGSGDGPIYLWDPQKGKQLGVLTGHRKTVVSLSFTADGKTLASGSADGIVRVWDVPLRREKKQLDLGGQGARTVEFSPDGKTLLTSGNPGEGTVRLWDTETWKDTVLHDFRQPPAGKGTKPDSATYVSAAFSPDGKFAVTADSRNKVSLWDLPNRNKLVQLEVPTPVQTVVFGPDGTTFAAAGTNTVHVFDRDKRVKRHDFPGFSGGANSLAYYPKARKVAFPSTNTVHVWELEKGTEVRPVYGHRWAGNAVALSPDGRYVVSASPGDNTVRLWDLQANKEVPFSSPCGLAAFSPDGKQLLMQESGFPEVASLVSVADQRASHRFQGETSGGVGSMAVSPDGKLLAAAGGDQVLRVWEVTSGRQVDRLPRLPGPIRSLVFAPEGRRLYIGCAGAHPIKVRDLVTGNVEGEYPVTDGLSSRLALAPDGKRLVAGTAKGTVLVWDLQGAGGAALEFKRHTGPVTALAFLPGGKQFVSAGHDGKVLWWEAGKDNPTTVAELPWAVPDVAVSADGRYLAIINAHLSGTVYLLRLPGKGS